MGLRVLRGVFDGDSGGKAVLFCSTTNLALPWMFDSGVDADLFVEEHGDVRRMTHKEQSERYERFQIERRRVRGEVW